MTSPPRGSERVSLRWTRTREAALVTAWVVLEVYALTGALTLPRPASSALWATAVTVAVPLLLSLRDLVRPPVAVVLDTTGLELCRRHRSSAFVAWDEVERAEVVNVLRKGYWMKVHLRPTARARPGRVVDVPVSDVGLSPERFAELVAHHGALHVRVPSRARPT